MSDLPDTRSLPVIPPPCAQSPTRGRGDEPEISSNPYGTGSPSVTPVGSPHSRRQVTVGAHGSPPTSPTRPQRQVPAWTRLETPVTSINFSNLPSLNAHSEISGDPIISHGRNESRSSQALGPFASPTAASSAGSHDFAETDCSSFVTIADDENLDSPDRARFQKAQLIDFNRTPSASPTRSEKHPKSTLWPSFESVRTDESDDDFESDMYANAFIKSSEDYKEPPSTAQPRRHKSKATKEVKLVRGNLILDCPVPTKLYSFLPRRDSDEFVYMRYTACTATADDFVSSGFTLRPAMFGRETELCICITMYNEDEIAFTRTMHAVMKNISYLCSRRRSRVWGEEAWKKIVVTIVSDGRAKINPRVLDTLAALGVYQDGIAKNFVNGDEVQAHIFEFTAQVSLGEDLRFRGAEKGIVPVQILFCLKEKNCKKINSHRWLFNALCPVINPNVCILLDVGTRPRNNCIYHLWKAFDQDSNVGGACGEVQALKGKGWLHLLNPLVAAQNFEYKISNILDKPMESVFGYISVLPGALSAYRYAAIQNHFDGTGPLHSYFKGEELMKQQADIFTSNMYLAEDRILCWELVAKRNASWVLKYVRSAKGDTDVPDSFAEFVSQRRRWLNGALFAACYSQINFRQIWSTSHSYTRKWLLHVEFVYQFFQLLFSFFSLGNFYLTFYFVAGSLSGESADVMPGKAGLYLFLINKYVCIMTLASLFIISLGNRPHGAKRLFMGTSAVLSLVYLYAVGCGFYFVISSMTNEATEVKLGNNVFTNIFVSLISTYGIYFIMSIIYLDPWHVITSFLQHLLMVPSYVCTLQIFAFCNTHDVTWGTKGDNESKYDLGSAVVNSKAGVDVVEVEIPSEQLDIDSGYDEALENLRHRKQINKALPNLKTMGEDNYRQFRSLVVLTWMTANLTLVLVTTQIFDPTNPNNNLYLKIILWSMAIMAAFRALGSLIFLLMSGIRWLVDTRSRTATSLLSSGIKKPW